MKRQSVWVLVVFMVAWLPVGLHAQHKKAVTEKKITGSLLDYMKERDAIAAELQRVKEEQEVLLASKWFVVNRSGHTLVIESRGVASAAVPSGASRSDLPMRSGLKRGEPFVVLLEGVGRVEGRLEPGTVWPVVGEKKRVEVLVDYLSGSKAWFVFASVKE